MDFYIVLYCIVLYCIVLYCIVLYWASLIAQLVKNPPATQETQLDSWVGKIHWRRDRLPTPVFLGFHCGSTGKESACSVGDLSLISGLGRAPGEGKGYPLQYSVLESSMDCIIHEVAKSWTQLSDFHFLYCIIYRKVNYIHSFHIYFISCKKEIDKGS